MRKYNFLRLIVSTTLLALFLLLQTAAYATTTYQYTGNYFTEYWVDYDANDYVSVTLTFDSPLGSNFYTLDATTLPGFGILISDGEQTFNQVYGWQTCNYVQLMTDVNGNIDEWMIMIDASNDLASTTNNIFTGYASGVPLYPLGFVQNEVGSISYSPLNKGQLAGNPGVWTTSSNPVPEPTSLLLLGLGLMGLAGVRRKMN